jgi:hypothetical protein
MSEKITLVECPRDAMQGLHDFIPTAQKIEYHNLILKKEFDELITWALSLYILFLNKLESLFMRRIELKLIFNWFC